MINAEIRDIMGFYKLSFLLILLVFVGCNNENQYLKTIVEIESILSKDHDNVDTVYYLNKSIKEISIGNKKIDLGNSPSTYYDSNVILKFYNNGQLKAFYFERDSLAWVQADYDSLVEELMIYSKRPDSTSIFFDLEKKEIDFETYILIGDK